MSYYYSDPSREDDAHALPDVWITELTAEEVAEHQEDEIHSLMRRPEFRLASMNSRVREKLIETLIAEEGITGGWCWYYCFPGCMPDSGPNGPFATHDEALADMRDSQDY